MKRFLTATLIVLTCATSALAKSSDFRSCTTDEKIVIIKVDLEDEKVTKAIEANIQKAFDQTAKQMDAESLQSVVGYAVFFSGLSNEAKAAISNVSRPVVAEGTCKAK